MHTGENFLSVFMATTSSEWLSRNFRRSQFVDCIQAPLGSWEGEPQTLFQECSILLVPYNTLMYISIV